jgi:hypothetical protein
MEGPVVGGAPWRAPWWVEHYGWQLFTPYLGGSTDQTGPYGPIWFSMLPTAKEPIRCFGPYSMLNH